MQGLEPAGVDLGAIALLCELSGGAEIGRHWVERGASDEMNDGERLWLTEFVGADARGCRRREASVLFRALVRARELSGAAMARVEVERSKAHERGNESV